MANVPAGLCEDCRHSKRVDSAKGSVFRLCLLHDQDARFPKYPRLPVLRCDGYARVAQVMPDADPNLAHLDAIARGIRVPWQPQPALSVNQATLRVVKLEGHSPDFHTHDVDECYVVLDGEALIEIEGQGSTHLAKGDAYVVRAGTVHRPLALPYASVLLIT